MALTVEQRFSTILWFLFSNGEDFRIMFQGKLYENVGDWLYCDGELMPEYGPEEN